MGGNLGTFWTDERVDLVRRSWAEGKSGSQIAALLGHGLTRAAVIGKAHRLGLSRARAGARKKAEAQRQRPAPKPIAAPLTSSERRPAPTAPQIDRVALPTSPRVTILDLADRSCRWPLGDPTSPDFRYCGAASSNGPYCAHHAALAYAASPARASANASCAGPVRFESFKERDR